MNFKCAHTEAVPLSKLVPNPKNPNRHGDKQIELLARIIDYQGQRAPIVVSRRSGFIIKGHGRLDAIKRLKWESAAVDYQNYENEAQEYADMIADNKIAELAEHDDAFMIDSIANMDLSALPSLDLLGMPDFALPTAAEPQCDEDEVPEHVEPRAKLGDVYQLGRHRLMCGDSTSIDAIEKLVNEKVDLVFTDPPYGISIVKTNGTVGAGAKMGFASTRNAPSQIAKAREYKAIEGDDQPFDPNLILGLGYKTIILWGANHYASRLPDKPQWLIWDKKIESGTLDHNDFSDCELAWTNSDALAAKIYRHTWAGMLRKGARAEELKDRVHPTQKPVGLCEQVIGDFSEASETVMDLYGGSGSTLIACEKTGRKCFMLEIDPHYVDIIVTRWEKYTGKKAELINGQT